MHIKNIQNRDSALILTALSTSTTPDVQQPLQVNFAFLNMYACIKLYTDDSIVAVIPRFELTNRLEDLRKKIDEDDLVEEPYTFDRVSQSGEKETNVEDVAIDDENGGGSSDRQVVKVFLKIEEHERAQSTCKDSKEKATDIGEKKPNMDEEKWKAAFKPQKPWEVKMIKIYSEEEVKRARGMRSTYLKFWNKRVKEICRQTPSASKAKISSQVNNEWRKEQTTILKTEANILDTTGEKSPEGLKPGTLNNNMASINAASNELKEIEERLSEPTISSSEKKRLFANQKRAQSQMKRAQEVMRKNLKAKKHKAE